MGLKRVVLPLLECQLDAHRPNFLGNNIAETVNSDIKNGSTKVSTRMTIDTSTNTQVKISQDQSARKNQ